MGPLMKIICQICTFLTCGTNLRDDHDKWDPSDQWDQLEYIMAENRKAINNKGHGPTIKKATTLGQAHEIDQKLTRKKYRKAELMGSAHVENRIGPG